MIVSITATGTGVGIPEEFREAVSTAAAVTAFVNEFAPPLETADYIGFDTGWVGSVPSPPDGNQWGYDRDTPGMIEVALPLAVADPACRVQNRDLTAPPGSPTIGLFHIVGVGATGAWAGSDTCIAMWNGTSWQFQLPVDGLEVWMADEQFPCVYKTTAWSPLLESAFQSDESGQFDGLVEKTTPVAADLIAIEDSASSYAKKKVQIGNLPGGGAADHAATHENGGADEISVAGLSGVLADTQTPTAHAIGGASHTASTLANLNTKVSDATLDDSGDSRTPTAHAASHENGGADEISVVGLSGLLGDAQTPTAHAIGGAEHSASTLANFNTKISDATLDTNTASRPPSGSAGGDVGGTFPSSLTVVDFTIASQAQGDVLYFNGSNWVRLAPGTGGQVLQTNGAGANPTYVDRVVTLVIALAGDLTVSLIPFRVPSPVAGKIVEVIATVGTAPTGNNILVDVDNDGTTIFTTSVNRPSIAASATKGTATTIEADTVAVDDEFTGEVAQIGSTIAGANLVILIKIKVNQ